MDTDFNLKKSAISRAISKAGGDRFQSACYEASGHIQPGKMVVTSGGNMHCQCVYNGVLDEWTRSHDKVQPCDGILVSFIPQYCGSLILKSVFI